MVIVLHDIVFLVFGFGSGLFLASLFDILVVEIVEIVEKVEEVDSLR